MAIYPNGVKRLIGKWNTRLMINYNLAILHVTAAEVPSQYGYFSSTNSVCSHFHVARDGTVEQYIDTAYKDAASYKANGYSIGIETQGADTNGTWSGSQVEAIARLLAWLHQTHGIPLDPVYDSKLGRRGIGYHSLGVPGSKWQKFRGVSQTGGALWSTATGKVCPGPARIKQIPEIIAKARAYTNQPAKPVPAPVTGPARPPIKVDGAIGRESIALAQELAGTPVDGAITGQALVNKKYHIALHGVKYNGGGSALVREIQRQLGLDPDGHKGPVTICGMQKALGVKPDNYFGPVSATAWQNRMNEGRLI